MDCWRTLQWSGDTPRVNEEIADVTLANNLEQVECSGQLNLLPSAWREIIISSSLPLLGSTL